jgi:transcriptional regulator with XRE-family HTH domain
VSAVAERFAENLAYHLAKSPLTQEKVAARAEIDRTQISKLLKGNQICRLDTAIRLAGALDIKPATLIKGITWDPAASVSGEFKASPPPKRKP